MESKSSVADILKWSKFKVRGHKVENTSQGNVFRVDFLAFDFLYVLETIIRKAQHIFLSTKQ